MYEMYKKNILFTGKIFIYSRKFEAEVQATKFTLRTYLKVYEQQINSRHINNL